MTKIVFSDGLECIVHSTKKMSISKAYSEPCQVCEREIFAKIVCGFELLTIFAESFILDVWQDSEYASAFDK